MSVLFKKMLGVLQEIGTVEEGSQMLTNGKPSKFVGKVSSIIANKSVDLGILQYNWNRKIGVDKINQAIIYLKQTRFDGVIIIGNEFSKSAMEQAERINQIESKKVFLMPSQS